MPLEYFKSLIFRGNVGVRVPLPHQGEGGAF